MLLYFTPCVPFALLVSMTYIWNKQTNKQKKHDKRKIDQTISAAVGGKHSWTTNVFVRLCRNSLLQVWVTCAWFSNHLCRHLAFTVWYLLIRCPGFNLLALWFSSLSRANSSYRSKLLVFDLVFFHKSPFHRVPLVPFTLGLSVANYNVHVTLSPSSSAFLHIYSVSHLPAIIFFYLRSFLPFFSCPFSLLWGPNRQGPVSTTLSFPISSSVSPLSRPPSHLTSLLLSSLTFFFFFLWLLFCI